MTEWKIHNGGGCPVESDAAVEITYTVDGVGKVDTGKAGDFIWDTKFSPINTYRVIEPQIGTNMPPVYEPPDIRVTGLGAKRMAERGYLGFEASV